MNIDEAGNIAFLVYGYMNRGTHEGQVGASAYYYDNTVNTIEELAFIRSTHAPDLFIKEVEKPRSKFEKGLIGVGILSIMALVIFVAFKLKRFLP